ncbi:MAG: 16S rRNA (adenine(1518)-N(6)/adenine(1519)-N(6))-dimethyltransferase RsmA [Geodermatophilaceae bacterium]
MSGNRPVQPHDHDGSLLGPAQIRDLARRLELRPTKSRGQNFVHDANTVRRIVRTADLSADDVVLEVGPGLGSLTLGLLPYCARVVAVELDAVLAGALPETVTDLAPALAPRLHVVRADALALADVPGPAPTALVANLPYNVAVPVLLHLLELLPSLRHVLVMVQAEVAQRLAAVPGSRIYGIPSVKAAWYGAIRRAGVVSRHVFWPEPNVDSELVSLRRRPVPEGVDRALTFAIIDAAFATRRKTLRAALSAWAGSGPQAEAVLHAAGIDPSLRGEALDLAAFVALARAAGRMGP